ncbi:hypothetical protein KI427_10290 [Rhodococcus ruber]|nr:hypothetical protein [Rhodococcus ruber]AXY51708.1 hypothetical protein YT1_2284 [Rhodococcus ruber]UQB74698.1 hypothetical protein KI427_10290 [Rhodococcus ruber]
MAIDNSFDPGDDPFMWRKRVVESIARKRHEAAVAAAKEAQAQAERER